MFNLLFFLTNSWHISNIGPKVSGHTASSIDEQIFLHGGLTGSAGSAVTDDFWLYNNDWKQILCSGEIPSRRMYAASSVLNGFFYLFGGWDPEAPGSGGSFKSDMWKYDIKKNSWEKLCDMNETLSRHCAETVNDKIIIHGFRNTLVLKDDTLSIQETSGEKPEGLSMCCSAVIGDKMLIFGGSNRGMNMNDCLYVLDTNTWNWEKFKIDSKGISGASMVKYNDNSVLMFGGGYISKNGYDGGKGLIASDEVGLIKYNRSGYSYIKCNNTLNFPEGRVGFSLNSINVNGKLHFVLQGGWSPTTKDTFERTWIL